MARPARSRASALLTLAVTAVLAAGCGAEEPPPGPFPPRPQDIAVDRLDPCQGFTAAKATELETRGPQPSDDEQNAMVSRAQGARSRGCAWHNFDDGTSYGVTFIDRDATNGHGADIGNGTIDQIAGYGIVRQEDEVFGACTISIDANQDRTIDVDVYELAGADGQRPPIAGMCRQAADLTTHVIDTLRTLGG
ncbi:DUF3558 family protein [Pseudonocardia sp. HH130630-07]|uniref:DUF3558 family protein n=1 Tax=Pseudonocardia sp. HH130630-07 TaxID=1690815 RepID=UPI0008151616|nr:DUF3558 family protein [Pseudonocardia sp. HH130630-07]ANY07523.1 hypothetical protein AFB00_15855 [Pseudonocardia sp. HH130630-07]